SISGGTVVSARTVRLRVLERLGYGGALGRKTSACADPDSAAARGRYCRFRRYSSVRVVPVSVNCGTRLRGGVGISPYRTRVGAGGDATRSSRCFASSA